MTLPQEPRRLLPAHPSKENLRKQAKRLAKKLGLQLADAQFRLAQDYAFATWAELMEAVEARRPTASPLVAAATRADLPAVRALLDGNANIEGEKHDTVSPLYAVCASDAPNDARLGVAEALLNAGAFTRGGYTARGATPLHAAALRGPAVLVRLLLRHGALFWQGDRKDKRPYDYAEAGEPIERDEILSILADRGPRTKDRGFLEAIQAIQQGDIETLRRLLDARPSLLHERMIEPDLGPKGYFSDPKLFWVIANNPTYVQRSPDNIVDIANEMLSRGVEQADKDYALELVMTNARFIGTQQIDLTRTLVEAGAQVSPSGLLATLGHRQLAPIAWLIDHGKLPLNASAAAGLGRTAQLGTLLAGASAEERTDALGMAVINAQYEAARLCLEAGADPNRFAPCHSHSTPLHQATLHGDIDTMKLLVTHGARTDIHDKLWRARPLGWSIHCKQGEAQAYLRQAMADRGEPTD